MLKSSAGADGQNPLPACMLYSVGGMLSPNPTAGLTRTPTEVSVPSVETLSLTFPLCGTPTKSTRLGRSGSPGSANRSQPEADTAIPSTVLDVLKLSAASSSTTPLGLELTTRIASACAWVSDFTPALRSTDFRTAGRLVKAFAGLCDGTGTAPAWGLSPELGLRKRL